MLTHTRSTHQVVSPVAVVAVVAVAPVVVEVAHVATMATRSPGTRMDETICRTTLPNTQIRIDEKECAKLAGLAEQVVDGRARGARRCEGNQRAA